MRQTIKPVHKTPNDGKSSFYVNISHWIETDHSHSWISGDNLNDISFEMRFFAVFPFLGCKLQTDPPSIFLFVVCEHR